jgi:hypothetical protein
MKVQSPIFFQVSELSTGSCIELLQLLTNATIVNKMRLKLEKVLHDNDFKVDICQGKLDPKMADLFPGLGVDFLGQAAKLLADNPWQNVFVFHLNQEQPEWSLERMRRVGKAGIACGQLEMLLDETRIKYDMISPQPSEESINVFKAAVALVSVELREGVYILSSHGRIAQWHRDRKRTEIMSPLLHALGLDFPLKTKRGTVAALPDLQTAINIRNSMKNMMAVALLAEQEREEKRKVSKK